MVVLEWAACLGMGMGMPGLGLGLYGGLGMGGMPGMGMGMPGPVLVFMVVLEWAECLECLAWYWTRLTRRNVSWRAAAAECIRGMGGGMYPGGMGGGMYPGGMGGGMYPGGMGGECILAAWAAECILAAWAAECILAAWAAVYPGGMGGGMYPGGMGGGMYPAAWAAHVSWWRNGRWCTRSAGYWRRLWQGMGQHGTTRRLGPWLQPADATAAALNKLTTLVNKEMLRHRLKRTQIYTKTQWGRLPHINMATALRMVDMAIRQVDTATLLDITGMV